MWTVIPSLEPILQSLWIAFTEPSLRTHMEILLGWIMCLGRRTEYNIFQTIRADSPAHGNERHPFDRYYNFFSRSAWTVKRLSWCVTLTAVKTLKPAGKLYLIVDDTLLHKRGRRVYALGWFRDAVASTAHRHPQAGTRTASGNHWVVMGLVIRVPAANITLCLPLAARLHLPGEDQPSEAALAKEMLQEARELFPDRELVLLGDGAYSAEKLLKAVWPQVLGLRPIQIVVVRDPSGAMDDIYLFTTDRQASTEWVVTTFSWRWSIAPASGYPAFKASKQVMQIEGPQHWCQQSIEKLAPWVWLMQSVVTLWHLREGIHLSEAAEAREQMGPWDSEYSLRHMLRVLRCATLRQTIKAKSNTQRDMAQLIHELENYLSLAA